MSGTWRNGQYILPQWRVMPISNVNKTPPASGTWYTLFDANNVQLQFLTSYVHTTTSANGNYSVRVTADGSVITTAMFGTSGKYNSITLTPYLIDGLGWIELDATFSNLKAACYMMPWFARHMKVEVMTSHAIVDQLLLSARWFRL